MRKITSLFYTLLWLAMVAPVYAVNPAGGEKIELCPRGTKFDPLCTSSWSFQNILSTVIVLLLIAAVVIALIFLIWGGIKWILSGGDKTAVESARNHIVGAIIGLIIAFAAFFILNIVTQLFLGSPLTDLNLPKLGP